MYFFDKVEIESQLMSRKNKKGASQNERPSVPKWRGAQPFFPNTNPRSVFNAIRVYPITYGVSCKIINTYSTSK